MQEIGDFFGWVLQVTIEGNNHRSRGSHESVGKGKVFATVVSKAERLDSFIFAADFVKIVDRPVR